MKRYINPRFPHFIHGADYNPEQWVDTREIWDQDMDLMKKANCNEMTLGIFSWAVLEPEEGVYDFSLLDEMIDKVYRNGGVVVLATPSGARPRWLARKYPEVLRVNENGQRNIFGSRHNHCYTSPIYREKVRLINTELAKRYGKHPAVVAWHLSNEYGGKCYCPLCENAFREFVREKYGNDVNRLNHDYWARFWSHQYDSFEDVEFPVSRGETSINALKLDFKRFVSHQTTDFMNAEAEAIRAVCPDIPLTTNMMPGFYDINYWEHAEKLDVAAWDSYPDWNCGDNVGTACDTAFWHDFFRSLKGRSFMLMESAPGLVNWKNYNKLKRPGMDRLASIQAVAHGADSVQYFQWRKSRGSCEQFHGAVVDHVGTDETRIFKAVQSTGATLQAIDEVCGTRIHARVAIVYDWENRWAVDDAGAFACYDPEKQYSKSCVAYYRPMWKRGINVDIVHSHSDFSKYDLLIAPMLYMTDEDTAGRLKNFVANGGTLYATYMLGMVNDTGLCWLGGFPGGGLMNVMGIWNEEIDTLYPGERFRICSGEKQYEGKDYAELIHARGARVLATYGSEFYAGMPALTVNAYGKGKAYYQAFRDQGDFWEDQADSILKELGILPCVSDTLPKGVVVTPRGEYLFVQNYTEFPVSGIRLDGGCVDLETGETVTEVELNGHDVKILKRQ